MPARRFPLVDALRAIAALAVVGTHTAFFAGADAPGTSLGPYVQHLDAGVTLFFLISGFLLYRPWVVARHEGRPGPATGPYARRRLLRIVPAYWLALVLALILIPSAGGWDWGRTPALFALGQTYRTSTFGTGLVQAWSLCVELSFYAFLPLWAAGLRRLRGGFRTEWLALGALAGVSVLHQIVVVSTTGSARQVVIGPLLETLPAYLDHFAVGMGLAVASVQLQGSSRVLDRGPAVSWAVAGVAFWAVSTRIGVAGEFFGAWTPAQYLARHALYLVIAACLMWPAVLGEGGRIRALLANRALAWIGVVSYGVFLWNTTVLDQLQAAGFHPVLGIHPYLAWPLVVVPVTLALATASWYGVERPLQRLAHRRRSRARLSPEPVAAG